MRIAFPSLPLLIIALAACGDDTSNVSDTQGSSGTTAASTSGASGSSSGTSASASGSTTAGGSESDSASTSGSTGDTTSTSTSTTSGADTTTDASTSEPLTTTDTSTTGEPQICEPGSKSCFDAMSFQVCADDGLIYDPPVACADGETCVDGECYSECELVKQNPSSVGCSFFATKNDNIFSNLNDPSKNDSLIAGNISTDKPVTAQLYFVPIGSNVEEPEGAAVVIPPKGTHTFVLSAPEIDSITTTRQGGVYRLETDRPIVAYQHSPIGSTATNDASVLLPEHALTGSYVVVSYPGTVGPYPSYFTAVALVDNTKVDFTVKGATAGGGGIPALQVNQSASVMLNRYGLMNVVVAQQQGGDLSGTIVSADGPLHMIGATECANVPNASQVFCDHMEEAPFPLEYWGDEYVAPTAPKRNNESYHWRIYGGEDGVMVSTTPVQPGFPKVLNKGEFYQFATKESFVITGSGPFLPVGYLESQNPNAGTGDPGMYQMVPTAQFLSRYAFVTGTNYNNHYAQIIRPVGGADVLLDGVVVGGYKTVGSFEVADVPTTEGAHFAESDDPFGIIQIGYTPVTSYAYPGGLKLEVINPQ